MDLDNLIGSIDKMTVLKNPSFSMNSFHPFNIIQYDRDGLKRINMEFAVSNLHQDFYRPQIHLSQGTFLLGTQIYDYFADPDDVLNSHNDKIITTDDHLSTAFKNTARIIKESHSFKESVEFQPVPLPFKVEHKFTWEIVLLIEDS
jgi:hypothetical protein